MRDDYDDYDPNGVGVANGNFLGLPRVDNPGVILLPLPFAPTVSFGTGTENAPARILEASYQLDVCIAGLMRPWEIGFDWRASEWQILERHRALAPVAAGIIEQVEAGRTPADIDPDLYQAVSAGGKDLTAFARWGLTDAGFNVLVGGDHSTPLGAYQSLPSGVAILQLDAHMDLREAYEGFQYSHASVMYNMLDSTREIDLVQVGIRDYCPAELELSKADERVTTFFAADFHAARLRGEAFAKTITPVLDALPPCVWLSLDVDVLDVSLCPNTGTPVPGGMSFAEVVFLVRAVLESGRRIVGMDLVETGDHPLDANVSARLIYEIASRAYAADNGA